MATEPRKIKVSEVLGLLKRGYTRYTKDDKGKGSIQAHYSLNGMEVKRLFQDSRLKFKKTLSGPGFVLEEDVEPLAVEAISRAEEEIERDLKAGKISAEEAISEKEALFS